MPYKANCQNGGAIETAITTAITANLFLPFLKIAARAGSTSFFSSMLITCAKAASMKSTPARSIAKRVDEKSLSAEAWTGVRLGLTTSTLLSR